MIENILLKYFLIARMQIDSAIESTHQAHSNSDIFFIANVLLFDILFPK